MVVITPKLLSDRGVGGEGLIILIQPDHIQVHGRSGHSPPKRSCNASCVESDSSALKVALYLRTVSKSTLDDGATIPNFSMRTHWACLQAIYVGRNTIKTQHVRSFDITISLFLLLWSLLFSCFWLATSNQIKLNHTKASSNPSTPWLMIQCYSGPKSKGKRSSSSYLFFSAYVDSMTKIKDQQILSSATARCWVRWVLSAPSWPGNSPRSCLDAKIFWISLS